jgi:signal transduction histidine kinase
MCSATMLHGTKPYGNAGLGLAIAREIVEIQRGSIDIEPIPVVPASWLRLPTAERTAGHAGS